MFLKTKVYPNQSTFLNDTDRSERITGRDEGGIFDNITKEFLGYWVLQNDGTVKVSYA